MAPQAAAETAKGSKSKPVDSASMKSSSGPSSSDAKGKRKRTEAEEEADDDEDTSEDDDAPVEWHKPGEKEEAPPSDWQAVFSAQANAYYFWNQKTNETTWTNPLAPKDETERPAASTSKPVTTAAVEAKPKDYGGIDPDLAYLDPSLAYGAREGIQGSQQARFNSRTGRFEGGDARTPGHVSDIERYKRQSAFFFDVNGWEKSTDAEQDRRKAAIAAGQDPDAKKHKPPTKEELARYKERAKEKKRAKQAWLYD